MTNADKLRNMTDEEIANIVKFWLECDDCPLQNDRGCDGAQYAVTGCMMDCDGDGYRCPGLKQDHNCNCKECFLMWLKQEVNKDVGCNS